MAADAFLAAPIRETAGAFLDAYDYSDDYSYQRGFLARRVGSPCREAKAARSKVPVIKPPSIQVLSFEMA